MRFIRLVIILVVFGGVVSCVPKRQFEDLEARHDRQLAENRELTEQLEVVREDNARLSDELFDLTHEVSRLRGDTVRLGEQLRRVQRMYDDYTDQTEKVLEGQTEETRLIMARLQATQEDLQRREDELTLAMREMDEKERRVNELETILHRQDSIVQNLRHTLSNALLGFLDDGLSVEIRSGKVYVSMEESLLFATGSTQVDRQGEQALSELAKVLAQNPDINIMIEGHTDDVPFRPGGPIKDNWELSVLRATAIVRILLKHGDIDPQRLIAAGRGEYHPVDPADTPEARRKNRRTEIILTPQLDELFQIIEQH